MAEIVLDTISKRFPNGFDAVKDLSLEIGEGEFLVLVGPSGCGKTTALRMIAGLEAISSGDLYIGGRRVNDVLERDRDIAMVFQNYALYPHMTVAQNIAFSLKHARGARGTRSRSGSRTTARLLGLEDLLDRRPKQLSGGQRQRVAMGRAIIREPQVVPDGRAALEPRREAPGADARRDRARCRSASASRPSTSRTTRSRR